MQLVNATPVVARAQVSPQPGEADRWGMVVAKATYRFDARGPLDLDAAAPVPLFAGDVPTPLGLLPRDDLPRADPAFEVVVLGRAHAPRGRPAAEARVRVWVGDVQRELAVFGDRVWQGAGADARPGPPAPFTRMPLTWDRAFGGSADVLVDADSPVTVADPVNRYGRGFDHLRAVDGLRAQFRPPAGYPKADPVRRLPNLEDPGALVARWDDAPRPACWATVPLDLGLHAHRAAAAGPGPDGRPTLEVGPELFHRAHPDWVIRVPRPRAAVVLDGLTPDGAAAFPLPQLRVLADWAVGGATGTTELAPQTLVLLPEERKFYLVYRAVAAVEPRPGAERSLRLRLAEGWYRPPADGGAR